MYKNYVYSDEKGGGRRGLCCSIRAGVVGHLPLLFNHGSELINANLAVTVGVTGLEESLGFGVGQCACICTEVLQEQLQLILLDETALVPVDDAKGLLHVVGAMAGQTTGVEEVLVVECVRAFARLQGCSDVSLIQYTCESHFNLWCPCFVGYR